MCLISNMLRDLLIVSRAYGICEYTVCTHILYFSIHLHIYLLSANHVTEAQLSGYSSGASVHFHTKQKI